MSFTADAGGLQAMGTVRVPMMGLGNCPPCGRHGGLSSIYLVIPLIPTHNDGYRVQTKRTKTKRRHKKGLERRYHVSTTTTRPPLQSQYSRIPVLGIAGSLKMCSPSLV